jgi:hypothetical protein
MFRDDATYPLGVLEAALNGVDMWVDWYASVLAGSELGPTRNPSQDQSSRALSLPSCHRHSVRPKSRSHQKRTHHL